MRLRSALLILLATVFAPPAGAQPFRPDGEQPLVVGTVRDRDTGRPVAGAYVWLFGEQAGAVTDSTGHYAIDWPFPDGQHTLVVRVCGTEDAARGRFEFTSGGGRAALDFVVSADEPCAALPRPPWAVGPSDTTAVSGTLSYRWGGRHSSVHTCDGRVFALLWPPEMTLQNARPEGGEPQFVRLVGREEDDPTILGPPGTLNIGIPRFYVREAVERRAVQPSDCPAEAAE